MRMACYGTIKVAIMVQCHNSNSKASVILDFCTLWRLLGLK